MTCAVCTNEATICEGCAAIRDAHAERERLDNEMRAALAQMSICSHAPTTNLTPSRSGEKSGSRILAGDLGPERYARWYGPPFHHPTAKHPGARDNRERAALIREAWEEVKHLRGHGRASVERPAGETAEQFHARIVRDGRGWPAKDAAVHFRTGEATVRKARKAADCDPDSGEPAAPLGVAAKPGRPARGDTGAQDRRRQRLVDLTERRGYSIAAAARIVGVSRSTAERDLGRRAA